ncbi:MAG: tetratricopeptide repeat protein, partial [Bryobacteraceae bacterium]
GGGHGAFSYFLLKALNGAADDNGDGKVDVSEIIEYLQREIPKATNKEQHPRDFGNMDNKVVLTDVKKPGIDLTRVDFPMIFDSRGEPVYLAQTQAVPGVLSSEATAAIARLTDALEKRRYSVDDPAGAFSALRELKTKLTADQFLTQENRLRIALEDGGQQVILKYLTGDQIPQTKQDFENGADFYRAAAVLTPESLYLEGRESFCRGRSLLYAKDYAKAADLLENAVRIDPQGAHAYNALGIAYLEKADYTRAIPAFRDAVRRAPHWAYPLHNLALAYVETGDYSSAIRSYQQAMRLTPQFFYLPYNLGLVYQRLNRRKDAELSYRKAMSLSPDQAQPYNALGSLKAASGRAKEAEAFYRQALEKDPKLLAARHNLALLLAENKDRAPEAVTLWRENLKQSPEFLPSRLSLAAALPDPKEAIAEYRGILAMRGDYVAARLALATLLEKTGDKPAALLELREAAKVESRSSTIQERIGDLEQASGHSAEAKAAYEAAIEQAPDSQAKKRLRRKLK